jgi:hypothetical protein
LIALIANACQRTVSRPPAAQPRAGAKRRRQLLLKTSFASNTSRRLAVKQSPTTEMPLSGRKEYGEQRTDNPLTALHPHPASAECVSSSRCQIRTTQDGRQRTDNRLADRSHRPHAKRFHAPCETQNLKGRLRQTRPIRHLFSGVRPPTMVEPDGIEPTTSCLQSTRSPN